MRKKVYLSIVLVILFCYVLLQGYIYSFKKGGDYYSAMLYLTRTYNTLRSEQQNKKTISQITDIDVNLSLSYYLKLKKDSSLNARLFKTLESNSIQDIDNKFYPYLKNYRLENPEIKECKEYQMCKSPLLSVPN